MVTRRESSPLVRMGIYPFNYLLFLQIPGIHKEPTDFHPFVVSFVHDPELAILVRSVSFAS